MTASGWHTSPNGWTRAPCGGTSSWTGGAARPFDRVRGAPRFSPDGLHVTYVAEQIEGEAIRQFVVVDDTPGKAYAWVRGEPVFSPDGSRVFVYALGPDDRFEAGDELPRDAVPAAGGGRLVLDHTQDFGLLLRRPWRGDPAEREQRPIEMLFVEERIGYE